jgi:hypothetical protein
MTTSNEKMTFNKGRVIAGLICLALALLLAVLTFTLPEDRMMFMIGDDNVPIVPAIILGVIGIVLLANAKESHDERIEVAVKELSIDNAQDGEKVKLNKRLETIGWGLFLIMLGGFSFVPHEMIAKGVWSIGIGVIMLGLNVTRYFYGIRMSGFTTLLGIVSLLSGVTQLLGLHSMDGPILLIVLGSYLILKPWFEKNKIFGKAEES